jgi:hypothetical protein
MKIDIPDDVPDEVTDQVRALVQEVLNRPDAMLHRDFGGQTRHFSCDLDVRWDEDYKIAELNVTLVEKETGIINKFALVNGRLVVVMAGTA